LGHPLVLSHSERTKAYSFILNKFKVKLTTVKANKLNHVGRLTYINYVFASIPIYYMSNIIFTKKFLTNLNAIIINFWWVGIKEEQATSHSTSELSWKICPPAAGVVLRLDPFQRADAVPGQPVRNNIVDSPLCEVCGRANEAANHIFFVCPFAASFWNAIRLNPGDAPDIAHPDCLADTCSGKALRRLRLTLLLAPLEVTELSDLSARWRLPAHNAA
jgi:hypothetical protein